MDHEWHQSEENTLLPEHTFYPEYTPEYPDVTFFKESYVTSREENIFQGEIPPEESNIEDPREEKKKKRRREGWLRWFLGAAVKAGAALFAIIMLITNAWAKEEPTADTRARFEKVLGVDLLKPPFTAQQDYTFRELEALWEGDPVAPHHYDYDHVIVLKEATCQESGESAYQCTECGVLLKHVTTKDHTPAAALRENVIDPDCITDGSFEEVIICSVCKTELSRKMVITPALGHTEDEPVIENLISPTCQKGGSCEDVVYCTVCHEELSRTARELDIVAHTESAPVEENRIAPTCTESGSYERVIYCTTCGKEVSRVLMPIAPIGHIGKDPIVENKVDSTCTKEGSHVETIYCSVCGELISSTKVTDPATGHTPAAPVKEVRKAATCTASGTYDEVVYCSVCHEELSRTSKTEAALGHDYKEKVTKPTCTKKGYTTHTCSRCKDSYKDKETAALGHNYKEKVTKPTCTEKGYTSHTCSRCGDSYRDSEVAALGHNFKLGVWDEDTTLTCSRCGTAALTVKYSSQKFVITLNSDFVSQLKSGGYYGWFFVTTSSGAYITDQESWNESSSKITLTPTFAGFTSGSSVKCRACFMYSEGSDEGMAVSSSITVKVP